MEVSFFVPGSPRPAGSKRGFAVRRKGAPADSPHRRVVLVDDSGQAGKAWRAQVSAVARVACWKAGLTAPAGGAVQLHLVFFLRRPRAHRNRHGEILAGARNLKHTTKPDALKLARAVEDALTGVIWRDDAQIVCEQLHKQYSDTYEGVYVSVLEVENGSQAQYFRGRER